MAPFTGFPKETLEFLEELRLNNHKRWFDAHRRDYERFWLVPARDFVVAAGEALAEIAPAIVAEPRVNGSIFRINRDTRFTKDKSPYKSTLDFWFWEGERREAVSGFMMRITPSEVDIGVGAHGFDRSRLAAFREAVARPDSWSELESAVGGAESAGIGIAGQQLKTVPRGFEPISPTQERLLKHGALLSIDVVPVPASLHTARLVGFAMNRWRKLAPIHRWLVDHVQ